MIGWGRDVVVLGASTGRMPRPKHRRTMQEVGERTQALCITHQIVCPSCTPILYSRMGARHRRTMQEVGERTQALCITHQKVCPSGTPILYSRMGARHHSDRKD